jgi:hypothetical protein
MNYTGEHGNMGYFGWRPAFHLGGSANYLLDEHFTLVADLLYSEKGFTSDDVNLHLGYISVPVLVRYSITKKIAGELGGGINYLAASYYSQKDGSMESALDMWGNRWDWNLCAGWRYDFSNRMGLTLRYEYGLSNVISTTATIEYKYINPGDLLSGQQPTTLRELGFRVSNQNIQLSLNYSLGRKNKKV